jgi:hypothetical protein
MISPGDGFLIVFQAISSQFSGLWMSMEEYLRVDFGCGKVLWRAPVFFLSSLLILPK